MEAAGVMERYRGGRIRRIEPGAMARVCTALRAGVPAKIAAPYGGIAERTFFRWRALARDLLEDIDLVEAAGGTVTLSRSDERLLEFHEQIEKAVVDGEVRLVTLVASHAEKDWRAAIALLSRRFPERYSERYDVRIGGDGGEPIRAELDQQHEIPASQTVEVYRALEEAGVIPRRDDGDGDDAS